jgi:prophage antirepressor-like protein
MPNDTIITLHYDRTRLDAIQRDGQLWLRVTQIVAPLGFAREQGLHNIINRHGDEFSSDETMLIVEQTSGGPQQVRVFSLRGIRLLAMLARTEPAARFRRWVLDLLEGRVSAAPRIVADPLARLPEAQAMLAQPIIRDAIARLDALDAADAEHQRRQAQKRREITRLAALQRLSLHDLREMRRLQRILARLPGLSVQPALPLDAELPLRPSMQSPLLDA